MQPIFFFDICAFRQHFPLDSHAIRVYYNN